MVLALRFVPISALLKADGKLIAVGVMLALAIFAFDLRQPLGVAGGVPYIVLVLLCLWARHPASVYLMATIGTFLTILGYILSPEGSDHWVVLTNRGLAIFAIWAVALSSARRRHKFNKREAAGISYERYAHAIVGTSDGLWDWDILTDDVYYSPRWAEMLGLSWEDMEPVVDTFFGRLHPDDRDRVSKDVQAHLKRQTSVHDIEFRICREGGDYIWGRSKGRAIWDEDGQAIRLSGSLTDVTEQKRAEEALRESQQRFEAFMTHLPAVVFMKDADGRHLYLNDAHAELLEIEKDSWIGKTDFEMFPAEVAERMRQNDLEVLEKGGTHFFEEITEIDGQRRHWLVSKFVFDEAAGEKLLCGVGFDITERKLAEEKLRISEERYRELFDESPVAIWEEDWSGIKQMLDDLARGGVKDWREYFISHREQLRTAYDLAETLEISRAAVDIYGAASKEELEEINISAEAIDEELDAFLEILVSFFAGQMLVEIESIDTTADESKITIRRRVAMPPNCRDDWSRVIYAIEDITERKRIEEQLRQAQKMEAVGQLTGGVAHEFNNLLLVILGNIEALDSRLAKGGPLEKFTSSAMKGALRGTEITESLLAFSRKQRLETAKTNINGLVLGMQNLFQRTLGETINIKTDLAEGLWHTSADAGQIEAALLNFVLNARDAMPDGGTITLGTSNREMTADTATHCDHVGPGDYVTLEVSDTGTGMTEEQITHAFEPFYTTKEVGEGTGLGLSVAFGFAQQSGGFLEIESELGQGTTIRLSLPRCSGEEAAEEKEERFLANLITGSGTIMVVEDDHDVRDLVVSQLTELGYEVVEAEDGRAAIALLDKHPEIDLLFSDVVLPGGMSGPEVAEQALHKRPDLKVLFTSGYPEKDAQRVEVGGKDAAFLRKPYRRAELATAIAAAMNSG